MVEELNFCQNKSIIVKKNFNYIPYFISLIVVLIGIQVGCSSDISTIHSTAPSFSPTTQALTDDSQLLGEAIVSIEGGTNSIKSKGFVGIEKPLASIDDGVKDVKIVRDDLVVQKNKVVATQKEVVTLNDNYNELNGKYTTALREKKAAEDLYSESFFGGKFWRIVFWIAGITASIVILDTLLWMFTGVATLNPLSILINLITKLFTPKLPSVGSTPRLPRFSIIKN